MPRQMGRRRRKVCRLCLTDVKYVDYKNVDKLKYYVPDRSKIAPRRATGACARHQRMMSKAIKRARLIAILPFTTT